MYVECRLIISGQYVVHLPDCRTQIVDYFVDEYKQVRPTFTSINMLIMIDELNFVWKKILKFPPTPSTTLT